MIPLNIIKQISNLHLKSQNKFKRKAESLLLKIQNSKS